MNYSAYDSFIDESKILDDACKSLEKIQKEMSLLITEGMDQNILKLLRWDGQLFICCEIPIEKREVNQSFLFPQLVYVDGTKVPDIDAFEVERFDFYRHRYETISNRKVRIRYANYFFQYGEKSKRYKYGIELCQLLCDEIPNLEFSHDCVVSISRLFEVALSFSIKDIIDRLDKIIYEIFSKAHSSENYLELLSISRIVASNITKNKNLPFSDDTKEKITATINAMINNYEQTKEYQLYRNCCANYIEWLKILSRNDEVLKVLNDVGDSYVLQAENAENSNLAKSEFYEMAAQHFANIGEREKAYNLKVKIKKALKDAGEVGEFKTASSTQSIAIEQLQNETVDFFGRNIEETFDRFSHSSDFVIEKESIEKKAEEESKNPIYKIVGLNHIYGNRKVFNANDDEDVKKHLFSFNYDIKLELTFAIMVKYIWDRMLEDGLTPNMVIERICSSEYMEDRQKEIIGRGINRFFENDYISALHILVPQFESYFRTFFEWGGFPTTSLQKDATQHEQIFNEFLRQSFVAETIDSNILYMIEFVMVEQLGKNLRNNVAHGLADITSFSKTNCLIVLYLFFLITAIKWIFSDDVNQKSGGNSVQVQG